MTLSRTVLVGDCRKKLAELPGDFFQCCVTSPPYWNLRDYGAESQIGLEKTPDEYIQALVEVLQEVRRVLRPDGTLWLNLGDTYAAARGGAQGLNGAFAGRKVAGPGVRERNKTTVVAGLKPKDLVGIPWRVAFALQAEGWWLRSDIVWAKPNPMPESVEDRPTKAHEYVFLFSKSETYLYNREEAREPAVSDHASGSGFVGRQGDSERTGHRSGGAGSSEPWADLGGLRNWRSVWNISTQPYDGAHFATMPPRLAERCVAAGSRQGDWVLDPFLGSGTTGMVAEGLGRRWVGIELNPAYAALALERTRQLGLLGGAA